MSTEGPSWSERTRLMFVERLLYWRGYINRRDLMARFEISAPQASNDLVNYTTLAPENCAYNVRTKRYEAAEKMRLVLGPVEAGTDLFELESALRTQEGVDFTLRAERPMRAAAEGLMRSLSLAAHRGESVEVRYFSVNSGTARWRRISPRGFGHDGLRWHVRGWCHADEVFKDFVVGRIQGAPRKPLLCPAREVADADWVESVTMVIEADPGLAPNRRKALEMDYGMSRGKLRVAVRRAMVTYTARRLGFADEEGRETKWREAGALPMLNERKELRWVAVE
jgi:hypothetical protein